MNRIFQLLVLSAALVVSATNVWAQNPPPKPEASSNPAAWQELVVPEANFKLELPAKPTKQEQTVKSPIGELKVHIYVADAQPLGYLVVHTDYPMAIDSPASAKNALDGGRDSMLARPNTKLVSEKEIAYGLYAGREITLTSSQATMHMRLYVVQNRLYNLTVFVPAGEDVSSLLPAASERFWNSFKLLEVPKVPDGVSKLSEVGAEMKEPPPGFFDRPAAWQSLSLPAYGFQVSIPSQPFKQVMPLSPATPEMKITLWISKADELSAIVLHQNMMEAPKNEANAAILLKSLLQGVTESGEFSIEEETPASIDGHPGRNYKLKSSSGGVGLGKAFIVGKNIHMVLAISHGKKADAVAMNRILTSFKLIPIVEKIK